jgi:hypothetical protein
MRVLLRKLHFKQSSCFMVFTKGPIYRGFATSDRSQNDSKMNFAMEPNSPICTIDSIFAMKPAIAIGSSGWTS